MSDDSLMKLHVHNSIIVIYIQYKFHEILFISYLVMAGEGRMDRQTENGWTEGQRHTNISLLTVGDNKAFYEMNRVRQAWTRREGLPG